MKRMHARSLAVAALWVAASATPALAAQGVAYVSNQEGGVTVIDLQTLEVKDTIGADAKGPRGLGITAGGKHLITANRDSGDVSVIDTATGKTVRRIPIGKNPEFVRVRGDRAFVTFEPAAKGGPPGKGGKEDDDDGKDREPAKVAVIDLNKWKVVGEITSGPETEGIEFSPDDRNIILTNEADHTVTVHDIATGKLLKTVDTSKIGNRPRGIKVSPDGTNYVVTLEHGDKLLVLDRDFNVVKAVPTGKTPYGVSFDRGGKRLFVAANRDKWLQVFDGKTFEHLRNIPVGERCWHFTFTPDDTQILVACGRSNEVQVFDAATYEQVKRIPGKQLPWGTVTWPRSMGSLDAP